MPRSEVTFDLDAAWQAIHAAQAEIDIYKQSRECFVDMDVFAALVSHATRLALAVDSLFERTKAVEDRIRRAAEHLPGRPDVAEQILSEAL